LVHILTHESSYTAANWNWAVINKVWILVCCAAICACLSWNSCSLLHGTEQQTQLQGTMPAIAAQALFW